MPAGYTPAYAATAASMASVVATEQNTNEPNIAVVHPQPNYSLQGSPRPGHVGQRYRHVPADTDAVTNEALYYGVDLSTPRDASGKPSRLMVSIFCLKILNERILLAFSVK